MQVPFEVWRQNYLPQHFISWCYGKLSHCQIPWFKNWAIQRFIRLYGINMQEAIEQDATAYPSFHDFFIRHLKPELRPVDHTPNAVCAPCDGVISQIGRIENGTLVQAKNHSYSVSALLGGDIDPKPFQNGHFTTIYLAPKDYHRVHMPCLGTLERMSYLPGDLFSVNPLTATHVDQLFARNERVVSLFKNQEGPFAMVLVGAMIVGNIATRWAGHISSQRNKEPLHIQYPQTQEQHIVLDKGEEMGYFSLGSTVIMLFAENLRWEKEYSQDSRIVVGQRIGQFLP
ncbi:archaetidylserine decarboxylase [Candidatus Berkiella aquae]|uniref:Phosphatidylserine decarboxylase proenzyme n=1 Tax=Candidatus Berkiella aquae TaxID=295108 RepID=A0A0Q9YIN0_9GAMM|nr:archaetidylserine decarboxylase [Candidatus Berkiella aquae]MCS5710164.1 phosphatidylserine decarboxylase [Candidatus Berkiella aquae]